MDLTIQFTQFELMDELCLTELTGLRRWLQDRDRDRDREREREDLRRHISKQDASMSGGTKRGP